ncbi:MAG: PAS domain S-box protein [Acidobacteria bacterium]|nr:PAS domain S-box protein [Acidobacteriota bacterium]
MESRSSSADHPLDLENEDLRLALRAARMGVWVADLRTRHIDWSPEVRDIIGVPDFAGTMDAWTALVHPDDRPAAIAAFGRAIADSVEFEVEFRLVRPDGSLRWLSNLGRARVVNGVAVAMVGTVHDITETRETEARRAASEAALRESEARFRNVLDSSPSIVFLQDLDGRYLFVNKRAAELSGVPQEAWIGHTVEEVLPAYAGELRKEFARVRAEMRPIQDERSGHLPDGRPLAALASRFPLFRADGTPYAICGIGTDITEQKRLEAELRQSHKMEAIGRLAGGVAHDFNNLLTVINGHCELLHEEAGSDAVREHVEVIHDAGTRAALLTGQLLAFSRKAIVEPQLLDVNAAVESAVRMLRRVVGEDVQLETRLEAAAPVLIDPGQLEQILVNLVVNARDAMPEGGRLSIATRCQALPAAGYPMPADLPPGPYMALSVADTGVGMSDETQTHIFEPFFTSKPEGKGTGLGLATVYGIVTQAGGAIAVESAPGKGTTIRLVLPAVVTATARGGAPVAKVPVRGRETVLVVEDEQEVRRLIGVGLQAHGYSVLLAASGADALVLMRAHAAEVDLVVTDVVMPDMGGRALVDAVRALRPGLPVVYVSGYMNDDVVRQGVASAADAFVAKPFVPSALARKVREVLDARPGAPRS